MVPAVEPHQTVWVVDPPGAGRQVIVRIPAQIQRLALCLEYRDVARRGAFADLIGGDGGDARRLQVLLGGGKNANIGS